jgi:hypothetical protein
MSWREARWTIERCFTVNPFFRHAYPERPKVTSLGVV